MIIVNPLSVTCPAPGIILEKSADGKLFIFKIADGAPETVNNWVNCATAAIVSWKVGHSCLLLHDLHQRGAHVFDAHMRAISEELYKLRPELDRHIAVVVASEYVAEIAELAAKGRELKAQHQHLVHWEVFTSREQALDWLLAIGQNL